MGQAKQRGTFEERAFKAKAKRLKDSIEVMRRAKESEDALTLEQRAQRQKTRNMIAWLSGISAGINVR